MRSNTFFLSEERMTQVNVSTDTTANNIIIVSLQYYDEVYYDRQWSEGNVPTNWFGRDRNREPKNCNWAQTQTLKKFKAQTIDSFVCP